MPDANTAAVVAAARRHHREWHNCGCYICAAVEAPPDPPLARYGTDICTCGHDREAHGFKTYFCKGCMDAGRTPAASVCGFLDAAPSPVPADPPEAFSRLGGRCECGHPVTKVSGRYDEQQHACMWCETVHPFETAPCREVMFGIECGRPATAPVHSSAPQGTAERWGRHPFAPSPVPAGEEPVESEEVRAVRRAVAGWAFVLAGPKAQAELFFADVDALVAAVRQQERADLRNECRAVFVAYVTARDEYRASDFLSVGFNKNWSRFDRAIEALNRFLAADPPIDIGEHVRKSAEERAEGLAASLRDSYLEVWRLGSLLARAHTVMPMGQPETTEVAAFVHAHHEALMRAALDTGSAAVSSSPPSAEEA